MWRRLVQSRVPKIARWAVLLFAFGAESAYAQSGGVRFITTPVTTATVGVQYVYDVAATNSGRGDPKITAPNGLPAWLKLASKSKGRATLSGTPTESKVWRITLRAEDSSCSFLVILCPVQVFDITVSAVSNAPPVVVPPGIPDQSVTENQDFSVNVASAFRDPNSDPLTFSATGLPAGWSLSGSVISGVATAAAAAGSPYTVRVTAADGRGGSVSDSFVLTIVRFGGADVFLSGITATPSPVTSDGAVDWVVTVGNSGPSPSGSVALTVTFAGNPFTFTSNPCTLTVAVDRQRLACTVGPIASGATQAVTFKGSASQPGDVYVTAIVAASATVPTDPNANNNASAASLNVGETLVTDAAQSLTIGAAGIAAGDFDGDGFDDLARVASGEPPSVLVDIEDPTTLDGALLEPGDVRRGLASLPLLYGAAAAGADVALADFDNDGDLDVVVANGPGVPSKVLRNDGKAVLTELATLGPAASDDRAVAVADMNGDGFADIVIASASGNSLYLNQNGTAFAQSALPASGGAGATDVVVTDVVGSSLPDLVFVYANGPTVRHENLGGSFGAAVTIDAGPASSVASADFNRDARADLVLARAAAGPSGMPSNPVYLNNGSGGFVAAGALGASPTTAVVTGDLDGDGASDVVAINASGAHQVFFGDGNGNFRLHPQLLMSRGATRVAIASIGRSQRADIVTASPDAIRVFFNDGHNNFGLGDTTRPVIQLNGAPEVSLEVGAAYTDQGATASDDVDGALTPTVTDNPVDPAVIGTYYVTYAAMDSAGNAAVPVTRIVRVNARAAEGGGGGAAEISFLVLLLFALVVKRARRFSPCVG